MRGWRGQVLMASVLGISFCLGTAGTAVAQPAPAAAPDPGPTVDINVFFHDLSPYGVWDQTPNFGWVWYPNEVPAGWRPYTHGHWLLTDDGWTWASDWDWGWGPFHYGRWFDDANLGWVWVPGAVWAPAWVMWEQSEDYIGWAPLPPQVRWSWSVGLEFGDMELESMLPPGAFVFVPDRDFLDRDVRRFVVPRVRSVMILPRAHVVTRYGIEDGRIIDHGIPPEALERRFGHRITRYRIEGVESPVASTGANVTSTAGWSSTVPTSGRGSASSLRSSVPSISCCPSTSLSGARRPSDGTWSGDTGRSSGSSSASRTRSDGILRRACAPRSCSSGRNGSASSCGASSSASATRWSSATPGSDSATRRSSAGLAASTSAETSTGAERPMAASTTEARGMPASTMGMAAAPTSLRRGHPVGPGSPITAAGAVADVGRGRGRGLGQRFDRPASSR